MHPWKAQQEAEVQVHSFAAFCLLTLLQMAGSGKGKCNKRKGKSKYNKPEITNKQNETSYTNPNLQEKQSNINGSAQEYRNRSSPSHSSLNGEQSALSFYDEVSVENLLYEKLEVTYKKALELLLATGYSMHIALKGNSELWNMNKLTRFSLKLLVDATIKQQPAWKKVDAMLCILSSNNIFAGTIEKNLLPMANDLDLGIKSEPSEICSKAVFEGPVELQNVDHSFTTPAWGSHQSEAFASLAIANQPLTEASRFHPEAIPVSFTTSELSKNSKSERSDLLFPGYCNERSLDEWLRSCSSDEKNEMIFSLHKQIEDCKSQLKKREKWSHEEMIKATEKLNSNLLELRMSRMEKMGQNQCWRKLQLENSEVKSTFAACRSSPADSMRVLQLAVDRQNISLAKIANLEKQISKFKEEMEEQKLKNLRLEQELLLARIGQKQPEAVDLDLAKAKKKHG